MNVDSRQGNLALVLGGGGVTGIAWMTGLMFGLREKDVDLRSVADIMIGTSAGSTVAAQMAGNTSLEDLFECQVDALRQVVELSPKPHLLELIGNALPVALSFFDPIERLQKIGELAAKTTTVTETERREVIAARLPEHHWPDRMLKVVAVDIETGIRRVFDRQSGVDLIDAVAASCAVPGIWPPVSIDSSRYMDGGMRSSDNADLASGYDTVVVISPIGIGGMALPGSEHLSSQVEALQRAGSRTYVIEPDDSARKAIGNNPLSPEHRRPVAEAGRAQGHMIASQVLNFLVVTARAVVSPR